MPRNLAKSKATGPKPLAIVPDEYKPDGKRKLATNRNGQIHHGIVDAICAILREHGCYDPADVPLIAVRVREWLEATGDAAQIQFVFCGIATEAAEQGDFAPLRDYSPGTIHRFKYRADVPENAYGYMLWRDSLTDRAKRGSADYWLGLWKDRLAEIEPDPEIVIADPTVIRCKAMLEKLRTASNLDLVEW